MNNCEIEVKRIMLKALEEKLNEIEPMVSELASEIAALEEDIERLLEKEAQ